MYDCNPFKINIPVYATLQGMTHLAHRLLILSKNAEKYQTLLEKANLPGLEIVDAPTPDVDIVFGEPNRIREFLPQLPALKWAQCTWAGVEPLLDPALRRDYILTNARGVFGGLMSEFVFGYLLLHERKILQRLEAQQQQRWDSSLTGSLRGKTLGLLGVGSIGAELARTAKFFGMTVRGYTRDSESCEFIDRYYHGPELLQFASGLDYLVSVLPNTSETRKIVAADVFSTLPSHAIFINVGRGSAVDEPALIQALETGGIAGAVLDVFEQEPLPAGHPFWDTKNLFVTFHTSAPSFPEDISRLFVENYRRFASGQTLLFVVNYLKGY
jgi:phosphoglycerate dehydrogenase-like enzyme